DSTQNAAGGHALFCARECFRDGPGTRLRPLRKRGAMRLSQYFLPLLRENPSEAQIVSHRLMLRAGMIRQSSAGIYSWLPLGFRVLAGRADRARGAGPLRCAGDPDADDPAGRIV